MTLSQRQWSRIHATQQREIETLVSDRNETLRLSMTPAYARIGEWLPPGRAETVLELGCGPGRFVAMLAQLGYRVTGVDLCGRASFPTWEKIEALPHVVLRDEVRAEQLPFPDASFDHVACMGALLYFDDAQRALGEMRRVLKPSGRLIVRTVNRENLYTAMTGLKVDPDSKNLYTRDELVRFLNRSGFQVVRSFAHGFWPPVWTQQWWYLIHTAFGRAAQALLSTLTPQRRAISLTAFAVRAEELAER
jgi:ubiquinone/menaquinone biosynthesis C-methylase UbiE